MRVKIASVNRKRVYVAYTGGTIGMVRTAARYTPEPGNLQRQLDQMPQLQHESMPLVELNKYSPLLDSANMTPSQWVKIARDIQSCTIATFIFRDRCYFDLHVRIAPIVPPDRNRDVKRVDSAPLFCAAIKRRLA